MAHILVTGGAGYIGSHTVVELLAAGHRVTVMDNLANSSPEALRRAEELTGCKTTFVQADVCDREALRAVFARGIDAVIHFAGYKAVGESVAKPLAYYRNNLDTTLALGDEMRAAGCRRLVFSSSATVYGAISQMPLREDMATGSCSNPYGWTKYMNEQILRDLARSEPGWSILLLRYFNPVGAHPSGRIGEDPSEVPNNLMPYITQVAVGRLKELTVFGNDYPTPDGTCIRDYIHVVDLARGHLRAIERVGEITGAEPVNLGTGRGQSVLELVQAFERATGQAVPYRIGPRRSGDLPVSYADPGRALELLGWKAEKSVDDMCADAWRWQSQNPLGYRTVQKPGDAAVTTDNRFVEESHK